MQHSVMNPKARAALAVVLLASIAAALYWNRHVRTGTPRTVAPAFPADDPGRSSEPPSGPIAIERESLPVPASTDDRVAEAEVVARADVQPASKDVSAHERDFLGFVGATSEDYARLYAGFSKDERLGRAQRLDKLVSEDAEREGKLAIKAGKSISADAMVEMQKVKGRDDVRFFQSADADAGTLDIVPLTRAEHPELWAKTDEVFWLLRNSK